MEPSVAKLVRYRQDLGHKWLIYDCNPNASVKYDLCIILQLSGGAMISIHKISNFLQIQIIYLHYPRVIFHFLEHFLSGWLPLPLPYHICITASILVLPLAEWCTPYSRTVSPL